MKSWTNEWPAVDAGTAVPFAIGNQWPGTTEAERWAALLQCVLYNQTIETGCVSRTGIVRGSFKKEFP